MTTDTVRALDSLHALLHATEDRPWPHVESMALAKIRKMLEEVESMRAAAERVRELCATRIRRDESPYGPTRMTAAEVLRALDGEV